MGSTSIQTPVYKTSLTQPAGGVFTPPVNLAVVKIVTVTETITEGVNAVFDIIRSEVTTTSCAVEWTITNLGTAGLLTPHSGIALFNPGDLVVRLTLPSEDALGTQGHRLARLILNSPVGCRLDQVEFYSDVLITDKLAATVSVALVFPVSGTTVMEFDSNFQTVQFLITKTGDPIACSVTWTRDGTINDQDLEIPQPFGTANFAANEFDKLIEYHILGDTLVEPNETLTLTLRTATNCSIVQSTATVTVVNDDVTPPPSSSPFVHRYPLQIESASAANIIRPSTFSPYGINSYNAAAGKVIDLRGRRGFNHDETQGPNIATFRFDGLANSCITGGTTICVNQTALNMPWAEIYGSPQWDNPPGIRVDDASGDVFVEGFHLHGCSDGLVPDDAISGTHRIHFNAIYIEACHDDGLQNDNCKNVTMKNCYIQSHAAISERPSSSSDPFVGEITQIYHCLFWQKRQRWCGDKKFHANVSGGDSGHPQSRKVGTWNSPTNQNNTNVNHLWSLHLGWGHKWWLKPDEAPGQPVGFFRTRVDMRNTLIRMDTIPVEGQDVVFPPIGDGIGSGSVRGSFYQNVTILWMQGGSWPFPSVPSGVTIVTNTTQAFDIWNAAEQQWFSVNGYNQSSNSFDWTRFP